MKKAAWAVITIFTVMFLGCRVAPDSPKGFSLPEGNVEAGKTTFMELKCTACHTVAGVDDLPVVEERSVTVELGGEVTRVKTYGELVTSIINPSHKLKTGHPVESIAVDGVSKMRNYNDVMTVSQLINLVAFLQSHYELQEVPYTAYPNYRITYRFIDFPQNSFIRVDMGQ